MTVPGQITDTEVDTDLAALEEGAPNPVAPDPPPPAAVADHKLHLILVDGSGFIFRAFHALPPMTRPDGTRVNAVFGFTNMLARLMRDHVGTHLAVIFDAGRTTFRNRLYDQYKAHRPEPPPELIPQFALIREATDAFGVPAIELVDWEADDLIASYARGGRRHRWPRHHRLVRQRPDAADPVWHRHAGPDQEQGDRSARGDGEVRRHPPTS